jgi:hypothetical protein
MGCIRVIVRDLGYFLKHLHCSTVQMYGESNRSVILQCRPWARISMVSIRGETPLQISDTVDLGKPVAIATCRTDKPYLNI